MRSFIAVFIFCLTSVCSAVEFKVLTFNIHDLPWPEKKDRGEVLRISEILGEQRQAGVQPQVVFLQEAFSGKIKQFVKNSGYNYVAKGPGRDFRVFNSGIYILSDYKILRIEKRAFGFACAGLDCGSNKGVVVAELEVPGLDETVWVANTHMNSSKSSLVKPEKYIPARKKQLAKIHQLLEKIEVQDRLFIFGGDFNTAPKKQPWDVLRSTLNMNNAQEECMISPAECDRISEEDDDEFFLKSPDHVFYKSSLQTQVKLLSVEKNFKIEHKGRPISDHYGVEVVFDLQPQ